MKRPVIVSPVASLAPLPRHHGAPIWYAVSSQAQLGLSFCHRGGYTECIQIYYGVQLSHHLKNLQETEIKRTGEDSHSFSIIILGLNNP